MSRSSKEDFKMFTYLGQKVKDEALKESSCMQPQFRELIGFIHAFSILTKDESFNEFIPALIVLARYNWPRMEVTDLSLMLGENITNVSFRKKPDESGSGEPVLPVDDEDL